MAQTTDELTTDATGAAAIASRPSENDAPPSPPEPGKRRSHNLEIPLISFAALLLEISWTRVSFKLFYYCTYLVIGLALLGIGCGAGARGLVGPPAAGHHRLDPRLGFALGRAQPRARLPADRPHRHRLARDLDYGTSRSITSLALLLAICLILFASFVAVGVMIATLFSREGDRIGRLYFADLLGAGLACAVVVSLLSFIGPVATIMLAGVMLSLTGVGVALRGGRRARARAVPAGLVLAVLLGVAVVAPDAVLPPPTSRLGQGGVDRRELDLLVVEPHLPGRRSRPRRLPRPLPRRPARVEHLPVRR